MRALTGERDLAVGIVACLQTHGSRANWHPHLHLIVRLELFDEDQAAGMLQWPHPEIFAGDEILTTTFLARLLHHVAVVLIDGQSYRLRELGALLSPNREALRGPDGRPN